MTAYTRYAHNHCPAHPTLRVTHIITVSRHKTQTEQRSFGDNEHFERRTQHWGLGTRGSLLRLPPAGGTKAPLVWRFPDLGIPVSFSRVMKRYCAVQTLHSCCRAHSAGSGMARDKHAGVEPEHFQRAQMDACVSHVHSITRPQMFKRTAE